MMDAVDLKKRYSYEEFFKLMGAVEHPEVKKIHLSLPPCPTSSFAWVPVWVYGTGVSQAHTGKVPQQGSCMCSNPTAA